MVSSPLRAIVLLSFSSPRRGTPFLQVQGACEEMARPRDRGLEESRVVALMCTCIRMLFILIYVLYKSKNILTLVTIGYLVGFIVDMNIECGLWAQVVVLDIYCIYWTVWDRICRFCNWVELPVQRRLCPIF